MFRRIKFSFIFVTLGSFLPCFCVTMPPYFQENQSFYGASFQRQLDNIVTSIPDQLECFLGTWLHRSLENDSIEGVACVVEAYEVHLPPEKLYSILGDCNLNLVKYAKDRLDFYSEKKLDGNMMPYRAIITRKHYKALMLFNKLFSYLSYALVSAVESVCLNDVLKFLSQGARPELILDRSDGNVSAIACIKNIISTFDKNQYAHCDIVAANKILNEFQFVINRNLVAAISQGNVNWVSILLDAGADVLFKAENGLLAINFAKSRYNQFRNNHAYEDIFNMMVKHIKRKDMSHHDFWSEAPYDQVIGVRSC